MAVKCRASGVPSVAFEWSIQGARVPQGSTTTTASYHDIGPRQPRKYDYSLEEFEGQPSRSVNRDKGETVESPVKLEGGRFEVTNTLVSTLHLDNVRKVHYTTLFKCRAGLNTNAIILCSLSFLQNSWICLKGYYPSPGGYCSLKMLSATLLR